MTPNVFALSNGLILNTDCRNAINKDNCLLDFCKAKINVFREATAFAKALMSAKLFA
jgi:hypothetical protein